MSDTTVEPELEIKHIFTSIKILIDYEHHTHSVLAEVKKKAINLKTSILHLDLKCLQTPCMSQELLIFPISFIQDIYSKKSNKKVGN